MGKITYYIYIILTIVFYTSCAYRPVSKNLKQDFTFCYKDTSYDTSIIRFDGYYEIIRIDSVFVREENKYKQRQFYTNYHFFKNGVFMRNYGFRGDKYRPNNIALYFDDLFNENDSIKIKGLYTHYTWGLHHIKGDTIIVQSLDHPSFMNGFMAYEKKFLIFNNDSIIEIESEMLGERDKLIIKNYNELYKIKNKKNAHFKQLNTIPNPKKCWLMQKKWFWCNEEDWQQYMDSISK